MNAAARENPIHWREPKATAGQRDSTRINSPMSAAAVARGCGLLNISVPPTSPGRYRPSARVEEPRRFAACPNPQ